MATERAFGSAVLSQNSFAGCSTSNLTMKWPNERRNFPIRINGGDIMAPPPPTLTG